jgi:hypothetical protein
MPLTVNGKIAFGSLPGLEELPSEGKAAPQTPANLVEELLCLIWTETLGVEQLGVSDNFFALGGHSLLGAQLTSRIKETFGVDIPVRSLFGTGRRRSFNADKTGEP